MRKMSLDKVIIGVLIFLLGIAFLYWIGQMASLWINGISKIADDVEGYYYISSPVDGEYSVEINLNDLKSNEGKVLFDDGENQIYVREVIFWNDNYELYFRSSGKVNLGGASLVSGIEHDRSELGFTDYMRAEAEGTYDGKTFKIWTAGHSGLNYRDGDDFGFYLIPSDEKVEIDLEEESVMTVTVSNLYLNLWVKK